MSTNGKESTGNEEMGRAERECKPQQALDGSQVTPVAPQVMQQVEQEDPEKGPPNCNVRHLGKTPDCTLKTRKFTEDQTRHYQEHNGNQGQSERNDSFKPSHERFKVQRLSQTGQWPERFPSRLPRSWWTRATVDGGGYIAKHRDQKRPTDQQQRTPDDDLMEPERGLIEPDRCARGVPFHPRST